MRTKILFHPQLRRSLPPWVQRDLTSKIFTRLKTTQNAPRSSKNDIPSLKIKRPNPVVSRAEGAASPTYGKTPVRRGPPERIMIYSGGTGKSVILGALRLTTIFIFGASCLLVAPGFVSPEHPWYYAPAIIVGGAIPMLFVAYTAAPYVNFVHLALPVYARRSRQLAIDYAKDLPPDATLYINTMKFTTIPRRTEVRLQDLVPEQRWSRPVSFRNQNPVPLSWWQGKAPRQFYTAEKSSSGMETSTFYPELWEHVYKQIQRNGSTSRKFSK